MGTDLVKTTLTSRSVTSLAGAMAPLGASAGSFAKTIACVVAERKRLSILDRAIKDENRLRELQIVEEARFLDQDSMRRTHVELERISAGERVAMARMVHEFHVVDAMLHVQAESELRQIHQRGDELIAVANFQSFVITETGRAIDTVLNVSQLELRQDSLSERQVGRALGRATQLCGRSDSPADDEIYLLAMRALSETVREMGERRDRRFEVAADIAREQIRALNAARGPR